MTAADNEAQPTTTPVVRVLRFEAFLSYTDTGDGDSDIREASDAYDQARDLESTLGRRGGIHARGMEYPPDKVEVGDCEYGRIVAGEFVADSCPDCTHSPHRGYCGWFDVTAGSGFAHCPCRAGVALGDRR